MENIRKALGLEPKTAYTEAIPETLVNNDFAVHQVLRHGFPSQPTCIAYDPVQQILAIGTKTGHILLLGKPGLEKYFHQPQPCIIQQLLFIINRGYLVTRCSTKSLHLWDLKVKVPFIRHELQFETESPTALCCPFTSEWMYVGTDKGNVHMAHVENFQLSGYCVYWNDVAGGTHPGDVISIEEHPGDQKKVLFAYAGGLCALWNVQDKKCEKKYFYDPGPTEILTSVSWLGNGRTFGSSYSDGRIVMWNSKNDAKPEKNYKVHENVKTSIQQTPIYKLQLVYTEGNNLVVYMGGYPEESNSAPLTLTISNGSKHNTLLTTSSTILDFLCLPSSPYAAEAQKPFLLVILTETELLARDLSVPGYPSYSLPYTFDLHLPPVTCLQYYAGAPEELVASLLSARSKVPSRGITKSWPLHGGKWGEETPDLPTDLLITGHTNGTINLWQCNSVAFQRFFSIDTDKYFALCNTSPQAKFTPQLSSQSAPTTPIQTPDKVLINAPQNVTTLSRSSSVPAENNIRLPANSTAPVMYLPLSSPSPASAPPQPSTSASTPVEVHHVDGSTTPGGSEDETDGHRGKKKRKGDSHKKKVKPITEEQVTPEKEEIGELVLDVLSTEPQGEVGATAAGTMLGISDIQACPFGWWMCVANVGGSVMAFNFNLTLPKEALKPHSLCINFEENTTLSKLSKAPKSEADQLSPAPAAISSRKYEFKMCLDGQPLPGFYLAQHCQCVSRDGVVVNVMQYSTKFGLLVIGTKQGLAVVDVLTNQLLHVLNSISTILYLSDPSQFSKQVKKEAPKKLVSRVSIKMIDIPPSTPTHTSLPPTYPTHTSSDLSLTLNIIQEQNSSVTVLRVVQMVADKNGTLAAMLWVGTTNGDVAAIVVNEIAGSQDGSPRKLELMPTRVPSWTHNHGAPIVNLLFLNKWGDLKMVPYNNGAQHRKKGEDDQPTYCVVVMARKLKTYTCDPSGMTPLQKVPTTAAVLKSDYFTCKDLPCLFSLTDDGKMLVHSLPGLKPLMESTFPPLHDPRVMCTLHVSGDGLGIYMSSVSQLQRISVAAVDRLNLPLSLPDVFGKTEDPQPPGKGIMGYFTTPQEFDKEALFGEGVGRPLPSLAKRNGQTGYSVAYHKHQKVTPQSPASEPVHEAAAQVDTTNDQIQLNRKLLEERKEKLSEVEEKASRLQDGANEFARLAEKLSKKERGLP